MTNKIFFSIVGAFMIVSAIGFSGSIYADNDGKRVSLDVRNNIEIRGDDDKLLNWSFGPSLMGTVTAVNGQTLTVKAGSTGSVYTVDASAAKIRKGDDTQALSGISVGDSVFVQGAISGTSVVATLIVETKSVATKPTIKEDMSGVVGKVTAISGSTITIKAKNDVAYTVNASNAKIWKNKNNAAALADVKVGDTVIVQGAISGTSVTATNIVDVNLAVNKDNKMSMITGTVTAISDTAITLKGTDGTVYTATVADASFKDNKDKEYDKDKIKVGDTVTIKGIVSGTTIDATMVTEGKVRGEGFFRRFEQFFKHLFGKK
jgi:preprotein translocase subunit YajC